MRIQQTIPLTIQGYQLKAGQFLIEFTVSLNNKKTDLVLIKLLLYRITKMYIYCFSDILIATFT